MAGKSLSYILVERKLNVGPKGKQIMQIAQPTNRRRVDFENFCAQVARATTFTRQEVAAVFKLFNRDSTRDCCKWRHCGIWRFGYA